MGILRIAQKLVLPRRSGAWDSWAVPSATPEAGSVAVDDNGVPAVAYGTLGWKPVHGMVSYYNDSFPPLRNSSLGNAIGLYPNQYTDDWNITAPVDGHWYVISTWDIEYNPGTNILLQEFVFYIGINQVAGSTSAFYYSLPRSVRFHRTNGTDREILRVQIRWVFQNVTRGARTLRLLTLPGGGSAGSQGQITRGHTSVKLVPFGIKFEMNGAQVA